MANVTVWEGYNSNMAFHYKCNYMMIIENNKRVSTKKRGTDVDIPDYCKEASVVAVPESNKDGCNMQLRLFIHSIVSEFFPLHCGALVLLQLEVLEVWTSTNSLLFTIFRAQGWPQMHRMMLICSWTGKLKESWS